MNSQATTLRLVRSGILLGCLAWLVAATGSTPSLVGAQTGATGCFPTCNTWDTRFLTVAGGPDLETLTGQAVSVELAVPATAAELQIGIFDGDNGAADTDGFHHWDRTLPVENGVPVVRSLIFELYAAPNGYKQPGETHIGTYDSTLVGMPDNDWFPITIATGADARAPSGNHFYRLEAHLEQYDYTQVSNFKLRVNGSMAIREEFSFISEWMLDNPADFNNVFPNFPTSPAGSSYDGSFTFFVDVDEAPDEVVLWDGDLDRGKYDTTDPDTDDLDTPNDEKPPWAVPATAFEGVAAGQALGVTGAPADDRNPAAHGNWFQRSPSVWYKATAPDGQVFMNQNPSGNREWEQFRIATAALDPNTMDHHAFWLPPGTYRVDLMGMDMSNLNAWRSDAVVCVLDTGEPCQLLRRYLVGDYVWYDTNGDGLQDEVGTGIGGVGVNLLDEDGDVIATTTTDSQGWYQFPVDAGQYTVQIASANFLAGGALVGLIATVDYTADHVGDTERTQTVVNANLLDYDFGFVEPASLGDYVWYDAGPNPNGLQDMGETGIPGVKVQLWLDNGDEVFDSATDTWLADDTTDADGKYLFENLLPGDYFVVIPPSETSGAGALAGLNPTTYNVSNNSQDAADSDGQVQLDGSVVADAVSLSAGTSNLTVDFGFNTSGGAGAVYLGNQVWLDANRNGIYEPGLGEVGIDGVEIEVFWDRDNSDTLSVGDWLVSTPVTGVGFGVGEYYALELADGQYLVFVDGGNFAAGGALEGFTQTPTYTRVAQPSDNYNRASGYAVELNGISGPSNDLTADFGYAVGVIGDQLWCETDENGLYGDAGDVALAGVKVQLFSISISGPTLIADTTTGPDGKYLFDGVPDGDYQVVVDETSAALSGLFPAALNPGATIQGNNFSRPSPYDVSIPSTDYQNPLGADFGYRPPLCFVDPSNPDNGASITYLIDEGAGTVTVRVTLARSFADTAYGSNSTSTGWPGKGRKFSQIVGSDQLRLVLENGNGDTAYDFTMDLLAEDTSTGTYRTGGVKYPEDAGLRQNDGSITIGASIVPKVQVNTSISENLVSGCWAGLTNSPPTPADYSGGPPCWIWDTWYEATVPLSAFGTSGFGTAIIESLHSSPSKTGDQTPPVEPCERSCEPVDGQTGGGQESPGTGTPGYWVNHPEAWPVESIVIGGHTYTKAQAITEMAKSVAKDKTYTMFPALVSAKLNVFIGNDASCIIDTIAAADVWMVNHPVGGKVKGNSDAWKDGEPLYLKMDDYNNGRLCAPHRG